MEGQYALIEKTFTDLEKSDLKTLKHPNKPGLTAVEVSSSFRFPFPRLRSELISLHACWCSFLLGIRRSSRPSNLGDWLLAVQVCRTASFGRDRWGGCCESSFAVLLTLPFLPRNRVVDALFKQSRSIRFVLLRCRLPTLPSPQPSSDPSSTRTESNLSFTTFQKQQRLMRRR